MKFELSCENLTGMSENVVAQFPAVKKIFRDAKGNFSDFPGSSFSPSTVPMPSSIGGGEGSQSFGPSLPTERDCGGQTDGKSWHGPINPTLEVWGEVEHWLCFSRAFSVDARAQIIVSFVREPSLRPIATTAQPKIPM